MEHKFVGIMYVFSYSFQECDLMFSLLDLHTHTYIQYIYLFHR